MNHLAPTRQCTHRYWKASYLFSDLDRMQYFEA
jgi:hypothetical protein